MGRIIEGLKDRASRQLPTTIEGGAKALLDSGIINQIPSSTRNPAILEQFNIQKALAEKLANMHIGLGPDILQLRSEYQGTLARTVLEQISQGSSMALIVADATGRLKDIVTCDDLRERAKLSLDLNHTVVKALRGRSSGKDAFAYLTGLDVFKPWEGLLLKLDEMAPSLRKKMGELDRASVTTRRNLEEASRHLSSPRENLLTAAAIFDSNLNLEREIEVLRNKGQDVSSKLMRMIGHRREPVSGLVEEMVDVEQRMAANMINSAKVTDAEEKLLRESGKGVTTLIGAQTLISADRAVRVSRASLELGAAALPMLGLFGISSVVEAISLWQMYFQIEIMRLLNSRPVYGRPDRVIDAIVREWQRMMDATFPEIPDDPMFADSPGPGVIEGRITELPPASPENDIQNGDPGTDWNKIFE